MFNMSLLERDTTGKGQVDENVTELEAGNTKKYEIETIRDNAVYTIESNGHLPRFFYLVFWKGYLEEENFQKPSSAVQYP